MGVRNAVKITTVEDPPDEATAMLARDPLFFALGAGMNETPQSDILVRNRVFVHERDVTPLGPQFTNSGVDFSTYGMEG